MRLKLPQLTLFLDAMKASFDPDDLEHLLKVKFGERYENFTARTKRWQSQVLDVHNYFDGRHITEKLVWAVYEERPDVPQFAALAAELRASVERGKALKELEGAAVRHAQIDASDLTGRTAAADPLDGPLGQDSYEEQPGGPTHSDDGPHEEDAVVPANLTVSWVLGVRGVSEREFRPWAPGMRADGDSRFRVIVKADVECCAFILIESVDAQGRRCAADRHWPRGWTANGGEPPTLRANAWEAIPGESRTLYETSPDSIVAWRVALVVSLSSADRLMNQLDTWPKDRPFPDQDPLLPTASTQVPDITCFAHQFTPGVVAPEICVALPKDVWHWTAITFR